MTLNNGQLIIQQAGQLVQRVPLSATPLTIGRSPDNDLELPDPKVSRRHAELRWTPDGVLVTDLGSANGTWIDGRRLLPQQPQPLPDGAPLQIGPFVLIYQATLPTQESISEAQHQPESRPEASEDTGDSKATATPLVVSEQPPSRAVDASSSPSATIDARIDSRSPTRNDMALQPGCPPTSRYLYDLPIIFHENEFLGRYLSIFESLWEPLEQRQDHIEMYVDPRTCPPAFLSWLAGWLGLALNAHWPETRRRQLLTEAMDLYRWRGTRYGLTRMIEVCTGLTPEITDLATGGTGEAVQPFVFRVRLTIPRNIDVDPKFVEDLVLAHKPAHAGYILEFR